MSDADATRWERLKSLFAEALDLPDVGRAALVERVTRDEPSLGHELAALLEAHEREDGLMAAPTLPPEAWEDDDLTAQRPAGRPLPERVGRYRVLSLLGTGGMGEVYLAHDPLLDRQVALKVLPAALAARPRRRAYFLREARAAASLNHPNITTIHEVGEADGRDFIAFEYVQGRTLRERLAEGALDLPELLEVALPLADALAYAHERGIVHRDVKPANVMVSDRGLAKLLDFGLAHSERAAPEGSDGAESADDSAGAPAPHDTLAGAVAGTPGAMSPEQARGEPLDQRSDVFSFGSLLYEMAAGRPAFARDDVATTLRAVMQDEPTPLAELRPDLPAAFAAVVERALRKDPAQRYQRVADLAADLSRLAAQQPAATSRRSGTLLVATLGALGVVAMLLARGWQDDPPAPAPVPAVALSPSVVAVMDIENRDDPADTEQTGAMLTRLLTSHLEAGETLEVVGQQRLFDVARQLGRDDGSVDRSNASEVARKTAAGTMVLGQLSRSSGDLLATADVIDVTSGRVLAAVQARGTSPSDVFGMAESLSRQIRETLREPAMTDDERAALAQQLTTSVEAYRAFVRGLGGLLRNDPEGAAADLAEAVALDPAFALAQFRLGMALIWTGRFDESSKAIERALAFREKLPPEVQKIADLLGPIEDIPSTLPALLTLLEEDPFHHDALYMLAEIYTHAATRNDAHGAARTYERLLELDPGLSLVYEHQLNAWMRAGRYDQARAKLTEWEARKPSNLRQLQGTLALWEGRLAEASELLADPLIPDFLAGREDADSLRGVLDEDVDGLVQGLEGTSGVYLVFEQDLRADILAAYGRFQDAAELYRHAIAVPGPARPDGFLCSARNGSRQRLAAVLALQGDFDAARRELAPTLAEQPDSYRCVFLAALLELRAGDLAAARAGLERLTELASHGWSPTAPLYRDAFAAELALAEGRAEEARAGFTVLADSGRLMEDWYAHEDSLEPLVRDGLARACLALGDTAGASAALAALIDSGLPRLRHPIPWVAALGTRGRLELQAGNTAEGRALLERFLRHWGDVEPELPEVAQARALLGG